MKIPKRILENGNIAIKKCKHGIFAYYIKDMFIGKSLDLYGEWTEPELIALDSLIFPGSVVVDVGAYIGTHSIFFAKKVGQTGFVFALEPQRPIYNLLCANVALNNLLNVKCLNVAALDKKGQAVMPLLDPAVPQNFGAISIERFKQGEPVQVITIDSLKLRGCNLIKIDVEGLESEVLEGARETIKKFRPVLYVENNREETSQKILKEIYDMGYNCWWHIFGYFNPDNFFKNPKNVFKGIQPEANLLCFPQEVKVKLQGFTKVSGIEDNWKKALERLDTATGDRI